MRLIIPIPNMEIQNLNKRVFRLKFLWIEVFFVLFSYFIVKWPKTAIIVPRLANLHTKREDKTNAKHIAIIQKV